MSAIYITEYLRQARDGVSNLVHAGMEPALAVQKIALGATSVQSAEFNVAASLVAIHADSPCSVKFGTDPTATTSDTRIPADGTMYFGVSPGLRVAVIENT